MLLQYEPKPLISAAPKIIFRYLSPAADVRRNHQPRYKFKRGSFGVATMRLAQALERLRTARQFVRQGERDIYVQQALLRRLERRGVDVADEVLLLAQLEEMQLQYVDHYDRVGDQVLGMVNPENE
jgi:hypothetical protein